MNAIKKHPRLALSVIVTGSHIDKTFGYTIQEIQKDGFKIDSIVRINDSGDSGYSTSISLGKCVIGMANSFKKIQPDFGQRHLATSGKLPGRLFGIKIKQDISQIKKDGFNFRLLFFHTIRNVSTIASSAGFWAK